MKLIYALLATCVIAGSNAQLNATTAALMPSCALNCMLNLPPDSPCDATDLQCICNNEAVQTSRSMCLQAACTPADVGGAEALNTELCAPYEMLNRGLEARLTLWVLFGISTVMVILRCYSRYTTAGRLWWDDWLIVAGTIANIILTVITSLLTSQGFGKHVWFLTPPAIVKLLQLLLVGEFLYVLGINFVRLSILSFFLRVFQYRKVFRKFAIGMIILVAATTLGLCVATGVQCNPLSALWDLSAPKGLYCINLNAFAYAGGAIGITQDLAILFLPIAELLKLQMNLQKKIGVLFMFSIGLCACVISMVRLKFLIAFGYSTDFTWNLMDSIIWSSIEVYICIICACLPSIRALLVKLLPAELRSSASRTSGLSSSFTKRRSGIKLTQYGLPQPAVQSDGPKIENTVGAKEPPKLEGKWSNEDISIPSKLEEGKWRGDDGATLPNIDGRSELRSSESPKLTESSIYHQQHLWDRTQSEESILEVHRTT